MIINERANGFLDWELVMVLLSDASKAQETGVAPGEIAGTLHLAMNPVELFGLSTAVTRVIFRTANESVAFFLKRLKNGFVGRVT